MFVVLFAGMNSQDLGEPDHKRCLARTYEAGVHTVWKKMGPRSVYYIRSDVSIVNQLDIMYVTGVCQIFRIVFSRIVYMKYIKSGVASLHVTMRYNMYLNRTYAMLYLGSECVVKSIASLLINPILRGALVSSPLEPLEGLAIMANSIDPDETSQKAILL